MIRGQIKILCFLSFLSVIFFTLPTARALAEEQDPNKKILKDAVVGAVTGTVAVEATKEGSPAATAAEDPSDKHKHEKWKHHHEEEGHHPPGWDKGRKEGWDGNDTPPGFQKGNKNGWDKGRK